MTQLLSKEEMNELLTHYMAECGEEYRDNYKAPQEKAVFETLQKMKIIEFTPEQPGDFMTWTFDEEEQDIEIEVKKLIIKGFERIKHEYTNIPLDLKYFALNSVYDAMESYMCIYFPVAYDDLQNLETTIEFAIDAIDSVIKRAPYWEEFDNHILAVKKRHEERLKEDGNIAEMFA